jgi:hypothetical protein
MRELFARIGREGQWPRRRVLAHLVGQIQVNSMLGFDLTGVFAGGERNFENPTSGRHRLVTGAGRRHPNGGRKRRLELD